jgi:hypothetical protein
VHQIHEQHYKGQRNLPLISTYFLQAPADYLF